MIIKYLDGRSLWTQAPENHNDREDSYSLAQVFNEILRDVQMTIEEGRKGVIYTADGTVDLLKTAGVEHIGWETTPYSKVEHNDEVGEFIESFHHFEHDVSATFSMCRCYWFAVILHQRFPDSRIKVAEKLIRSQETLKRWKEIGFPPHLLKETVGCLHFVTEIDGRDYDISGDVTGQYITTPWDEYQNGPGKDHIIDTCIL